MVNLRTFDLNLLVMFEALVTERHVTRAARRLGVTQPAMTSALNRLRAAFDDALLIRSPAGMVPTTKALELLGPISAVLRDIDRIFEHEHQFDPAASKRTFRVRMSDLLAAILLPDLARRFRVEAPAARLEIVSLAPERIAAALESREIDLALSMGIEHTGAVAEEVLLTDQFVLIRGARSNTTAMPSSNNELRGAPYFKVAHGRFDTIFTDGILAELGADQSVAISAVNWLAAGPILEETDLVLLTSRRFAVLTAQRFAVKIDELPIATPSIAWCAYWHRRDEGDQPLRWLRRLVTRSCQTLKPPSGCSSDA